MIAVIDYDTGNICSVKNALSRVGAEYVLTADADVIRSADKVLLPGVGDASVSIANLRLKGLDQVVMSLRQPVLGICVGMQIMCRHSEEGDADCLGIFNTDVKHFIPSPAVKIPHMGWNVITQLKSPLFDGIDDGSFVYYVHSFYPELCEQTIAQSEHGIRFSGSLSNGNFYGTQFHPEKSGVTGERILKNFLKL